MKLNKIKMNKIIKLLCFVLILHLNIPIYLSTTILTKEAYCGYVRPRGINTGTPFGYHRIKIDISDSPTSFLDDENCICERTLDQSGNPIYSYESALGIDKKNDLNCEFSKKYFSDKKGSNNLWHSCTWIKDEDIICATGTGTISIIFHKNVKFFSFPKEAKDFCDSLTYSYKELKSPNIKGIYDEQPIDLLNLSEGGAYHNFYNYLNTSPGSDNTDCVTMIITQR